MENPLLRKFDSFGPLAPADRHFLARAMQRTSSIAARRDIVQEGDRLSAVNVILEGWACRYKQLEDGRRQIIALFLPGDMCDPYVHLFRAGDQSLGTLTPVTVAHIPHETIRAMAAQSTALAEALWWDMQVTTEIQREWTVSLGRRSSVERLAHLFCELAVRLHRVSMINGPGYELPITQADLGDAMGLSTVHVNRSLQDLRSRGCLALKGKRLTIHDETVLRQLAMFNPGYLHVQSQQKRTSAD